MSGRLSPSNVSTKLQKVAELAKKSPSMVLTTLAHHIDLEWLQQAYRLTRKDGAVGVDKQTAEEYAVNLEENLKSLLDRFKSGTYKAPPVRRVHIPKDKGATRPIGVPTFEDKVLQRAVVMLLEAIYEQDFLDCSYGFRPGRSAHQALQTLGNGLRRMGGGYVYEVDIRKFFDTLDHRHLRDFLDQRVRDGVLRRAIDKWLKAGVLESGQVEYPDGGTPQGGVVSPLLANIYLHEVLDKWFEQQVRPLLRGNSFLIRYADDFVIVFSVEKDALKVAEALPKRLERFGLSVHPEKTRLLYFRPPVAGPEDKRRPPESFDLLGFTHYWGLARNGIWTVKVKTAKDRFARGLRRINELLSRVRHMDIGKQHEMLRLKLLGHNQYYGITHNYRALKRFRATVAALWFKWLGRRFQKGGMRWDIFNLLLKRYRLPPAKVVHSIFRRAASP